MSKPIVQVRGVRAAVERFLCAHERVCFGPMRDICYDCLAILDEHPNGRGRKQPFTEPKETGRG